MTTTILRVGSTGPVVAALQQALLENGFLPPSAALEQLQREYGPETDGAVRSFQASVGLLVDGMAGPKTLLALQGPPGAPLAYPLPDVATATPIGRTAVLIADAEVHAGTREVPAGSNRGPRVDVFLIGDSEDAGWLLHFRRGQPAAEDGYQGAPWCGRFAKWCVDQAAKRIGVRSPLAGAGDLASASKWRSWAQRAGRWYSDPVPGRVGVIIVEGTGVPPHGHLVLVAGPVDAAGMVWTREGNSGNACAARHRSVSEFAGFVELVEPAAA